MTRDDFAMQREWMTRVVVLITGLIVLVAGFFAFGSLWVLIPLPLLLGALLHVRWRHVGLAFMAAGSLYASFWTIPYAFIITLTAAEFVLSASAGITLVAIITCDIVLVQEVIRDRRLRNRVS
jgi:hypothetical protein